MSKMLDREGVFMASPISWGLQKKDSGAVAMVIEFGITGQWNGDGWDDWSGYEDHSITGWFWVIKKDGSLNSMQVTSLAEALGWEGDISQVNSLPPRILCQITCKYEEYNGNDRLKVQWINHKDYRPGLNTADPAEISDLAKVYGGQMRAACGAALKASAYEKPKPIGAKGDRTEDDDLPF